MLTRRLFMTAAATVTGIAVGTQTAAAATTIPGKRSLRRAGLSRPAPSASVKPTRYNTGVPQGWTPTRTISKANSYYEVTQAGAVFEDVLFECCVRVSAANVTFRRCRFVGNGLPNAYIALLSFNPAGVRNALVEDCTIAPTRPDPQWNGITGHDFTARRVKIRNVVDVFEIYNTSNVSGPVNVLIEGCFGADFMYVSSATKPAGLSGWDGYTHNDWCQVQGGSDITLRYNVMDSRAGNYARDELHLLGADRQVLSNMMILPNLGLISGVAIHDNWCYGGKFAFNLNNKPNNQLSPGGRSVGHITNNKFGRGVDGAQTRVISMPYDAVVTTDGNVYEDDGSPVRVYHNG